MKIKNEGDTILAPKYGPDGCTMKGMEPAVIVDRLATQYFVEWEDGACAFFFTTDSRLKEINDAETEG